MSRISPLKIEILLHYYYSPHDHSSASPAHREAYDEFVKLGLLRVSAKPGIVYEGNAEALRIYVYALCAVPLPERRWVIPTQSNEQP
jgi:hypothetical protein